MLSEPGWEITVRMSIRIIQFQLPRFYYLWTEWSLEGTSPLSWTETLHLESFHFVIREFPLNGYGFLDSAGQELFLINESLVCTSDYVCIPLQQYGVCSSPIMEDVEYCQLASHHVLLPY